MPSFRSLEFGTQICIPVRKISLHFISFSSLTLSLTLGWKEYEKQLEKVIDNTIDIYGSIRGIGGKAIQPVKALELPAPVEKSGE